MEVNVIYEKHFPKRTIEVDAYLLKDVAQTDGLTLAQSKEKVSKDLIYVPLLERIAKAKEFVAKAIEISSLYEIDIEIRYDDTCFSVDYRFNCSGSIGFLKDVIIYADDIAFFSNIEGHDIVLSINYYTHAIYKGTRKIMP